MKRLLLGLFFPVLAFAFPENVKHGYVNCTSCHISPSGGGVLTPYGRGLSADLISTWGSDKETPFLWGAVGLPQWLEIGGDIRWVQTYRDNPAYTAKETIFMQADLEVAVQKDKFYAVVSGGKSEFKDPKNMGDMFVSRRHYLGYRVTDELQVRAGRFMVPYGIYSPQHTIVTRKGLGFDQNMETYNIEGSYLADDYDFFLAASAGRPDNSTLNREKGITMKGGLNLGESMKVGISSGYFTQTGQYRILTGPYAMLGFTEDLILLAEVDFQRTVPDGAEGYWGFVNYFKLDYEAYKGVHVYLANDIAHLRFDRAENHVHGYALGVQWFPRPHFEIQAEFQKLKIQSQWNEYTDLAFLLLHYYF